jgi:hypothetical protein
MRIWVITSPATNEAPAATLVMLSNPEKLLAFK